MSAEAGLEQDVRTHLIGLADRRANGAASKIERDKARRDAELYASIVSHLKALRAADPGATCLLVSSARRLAIAETKFKESGEPHLVVNISSVLYLISMLPTASLGLSAMKAFLFDERRQGFSSDLERTLLRMVRSSQEVSMPFAKRGLLMRAMRERLLEDAAVGQEPDAKRVTLDSVEREALKPANEKRTIELLRDSLDEIGADSRLELENAQLRKKLRELEAQMQHLRDRR